MPIGSSATRTAAAAFAGVAALLHVAFFLIESVLFARPDVHERFGFDAAGAEVVADFAFNQGFYNLFLALGALAGLALFRRHPAVGRTLTGFACACMLGAGVVLFATKPGLVAAASIQAVPSALALALGAIDLRGEARGQ